MNPDRFLMDVFNLACYGKIRKIDSGSGILGGRAIKQVNKGLVEYDYVNEK